MLYAIRSTKITPATQETKQNKLLKKDKISKMQKRKKIYSALKSDSIHHQTMIFFYFVVY